MVRKLIALSLFSATGCFAATFAKLPLTFETYGETGQYISRTAGFNLLINNQEAVFALSGKPAATIHISVSGASKRAIATGEELLPGRVNYFVGTDRSKWRTNVEQYSRVRVREILPSTDIIYYGNPKQPEYDLILRPGADPAAIHFRFTGTLPVLMPNGDLLLKTSAGEIVEHRPVIEQDGKPVEGRFRLDPNGTVGFEIARYDHTRELRIDPSITYSTYLGGTSNDSPNAIVLDSSGNAYIAGSTSSFNFPVTGGALQTSFPGIFQTVAFVAKLNSTGSGLIYTTFLGGTGLNAGDSANAIAVDSLGNAYVAGTTGSTNFPVTAGAAATTLSGPTDGFVTKLNPTGTALVYSTFVGGTAQESIAGIAIDSSGNAFIAGSTGSTNFPVTVGAPQLTLKSANDAFVAKLNPAGSKLLYATYLGGTAEDDAYAIAADSSGNAYVTGNTASTDFPITSAAYKKTIGPAPVVFVVKINAAGTSFTYATYLGGTGGDAGNTIGVDSAGNVYIAGTTASADYPTTTGVISTAAPGISSYGHAFVTKLNPTGSALLYSTFLGGGGSDGVNGMAVDASGDAILTGFTYSANFPATANSVDPVINFSPAAFLTVINPAATSILYSTLLGATGSTVGQAVAMDSTNHAFVTGYTGSFTFPTSSVALQNTNGISGPGASTGFAVKIDLGSATSCSLSFSPTTTSLPVGGGSVTISVVAPAGCAWEATTFSGWVALISPSSGVGPGSVTLTADSNATSLSSRTGTITAGAGTLSITQPAGSCASPQFYPAAQTFPNVGGPGSVAVIVPTGCSIAAISGAAWITITSGAAATGDDLVTFTIAPNAGNSRSGTMTIAGATYTITQASAPCGISLTPSSSSINGNGGSITASLITSSGCPWTASSANSWLTVSPLSGTGSATLTLTAGANTTGASQNGTVTAAGLSVVVTQAVSSPPILNIETPSAGSTLAGIVNVGGWAIDSGTAVATIQIKVDGVAAGYATASARGDVCAAFGNKPGCPNVGLNYALNTSAYTNGSHIVSVSATDGDTIPATTTASITVTIANTPPALNVESPAQGSVVAGIVNVTGWAIDNGTPIATVQIKVDGVAVGNATAIARADVCAAYGAKPGCPNVGFTYALNIAGLANGSHTVTVVATDSDTIPDAATSNIAITIANPPPLLNVESIRQGSVLSGTASIAGWAIANTTSIASVQIKIDGTAVGTASSAARGDVCAAYGTKPGCPNVGFLYSLNTSAIANGSHNIAVIATDSNPVPNSSTASFTVNVANSAPIMNVESPAPNSVLSGVINVVGWAFDNLTAISNVQIKVDGTTVGTATSTARGDVCAAYGAKPGCPNVGFTYALNTSGLIPGTHAISVVATNTNASPSSSTVTVNVTVAVPPFVNIEVPASGATISGVVNVGGWAINSRGSVGTPITGLQVKVDGTVVGNASYNIARPDVCSVFPGRPNCPNVGFTYALNTSALSSGTHTITVAATDSDATPVTGASSITVTK